MRTRGTRHAAIVVFLVLLLSLLVGYSPSTPRARVEAAPAALASNELVVPGSLATVEGDSNLGTPFNLAAFGVASNHYQQVYKASELTKTGVIDKIAFRRNLGEGNFSVSGISVEIRLSHTTKAVDGLSPTFADNPGTGETVVLDTTNLSISSTGSCPAGGPCPFDIIIDVDNLFTYNGTDNLLVDIRARNAVTTGQLDMEESFGDSVSNLASTTSGGTVTDSSGVLFSRGLVTKFVLASAATSVPGVSSVGLGLLSALLLAGVLWTYRKRRRRAAGQYR